MTIDEKYLVVTIDYFLGIGAIDVVTGNLISYFKM